MRVEQLNKNIRPARNAYTLIELLVVAAIVSTVAITLFPALVRESRSSKKSNDYNLKKIASAAIAYGADYDERIPIVINGEYRNLKNVADGSLTAYGDQRSDLWPLLIMPYLKDRSLYVDPERKDAQNVFSGPPHASSDPGYDPYGATYRNQNRYPFFGMNYLFLSPLAIPSSKMSDPAPSDFIAGEVHRFFQADDPKRTVFFVPTMRGRLPANEQDRYGTPKIDGGFFGVNAPGLYNVLTSSTVPYVAQWTGTVCSGDWCGVDIDPITDGVQTSHGFFYENPRRAGNNVAFLDGHVHFSKTIDLAGGTDYLTATPNGPDNGGGANITDKAEYLWNLDDNYYGA